MFKECMENIDTDVVVYGVNPLTLTLKDQICNSCYCQAYSSYNVCSDNLVLDQLITTNLYFSLFSSFIWLIIY